MTKHKSNQQLCDDSRLIAVLRKGDQSAEHPQLIEHIEQCSRCQQRFDELAAEARDWAKVRQALLNEDAYFDSGVGSAKWFDSLRNEVPIAWTESMASQVLSPASHPELLGRLGRYDVERLIGSGGMGIVFKAHDSELNRPVAIKILAPYLSGSGPARKRFAREARAAAAVVHEHVVPIYNVETEREIPFLVMHYIAGESLQARIDRDGPLELCEILRIGMQVASGLSTAHQQGLVHRDIKPSNILMEQGVERALITDFGLARAADDASLTRTGFHPGTPQYMSPEQASGEQVDARSDLFSLGSVLYTMCTGRPPFRAETSLGVLRRITDVEPRPIRDSNPNIPEWLEAIISKLMEKRVDDRFQSAAEVANKLRDGLAHAQNPIARPCPVVSRTPDSSSKSICFKFFTGASRMVISKTVLGIVSFVSLSALALFLQPNGASDQEQLSSLQGEWVLETMTRGGVEIPPEQLFNERLVVESTQFARLQTKPNGEELRSETGRISVGLDEERKSIDFHLSQGTIYGVYEIKEGKLILCISREGGSRPDSLSSIQDDNRVLQQFVKSAKQTEVPTIESQHGTWTETWLKKIPSELPKDASDAKKWMEDHSFESILSGELTPEVAKKVNPDVKFEAYAQLKAKTYLFGKLTSKSKMATSPAIEVYCFVNELNEVVGMQVHPTKN